jgi:hypothetical protein
MAHVTLTGMITVAAKRQALPEGYPRRPGREKPMFDLIGDIHGHADALVRLLDALG